MQTMQCTYAESVIVAISGCVLLLSLL